MGGKTGPIEFGIIENGRHRTTKEKKDREKYEKLMKIGNHTFKITQKILNNQYALSKWNELVGIYKGFDFVTDIDIGTIETYCLTYAEYMELIDCKNELENKINDKLKLYHAISELKIDQKINNKVDLKIKLEDRLFLNPASRIKFAAAKSTQPKESYLDSIGFGNV